MKKQITILSLLLVLSLFSIAQTNYWNGSYNAYWHNNNNWSLGHIPLSTEHVVITTAGYNCATNTYDETCASLTINSGAQLTIYTNKVTVNGNVNISGSLNMQNSDSDLDCIDITWLSGSSATMTGSSTIYVSGSWEFSSGAEVFLTSGFVNFDGASNSYIRSKDDDSYFNHIRNYKSSGLLGHSGNSNYPLDINGNFYCYAGTEFRSYSNQPIELGGLINNISGHLYIDNGTFKFDGGSTTNHFMPGDYLNNFTNASTGTTTFDDDIEIKGTVRLESGIFNPGNNTITVGGNWENIAGIYAFAEGGSRVIFNGSTWQYCNYDENFYTLEIDKTSALRINSSSAELYCSVYDWTSGAIDILEGSFTANDLANNSIAGVWYLNDGGEINLTNSSGYVDLTGDLHIYGGYMHIYGGNDDSFWPYDANASIEMSGGSLKFHDVGIYIRSTGTLTENITDGWIACAGNLRVDRSDFSPSGGLFAMLGLTNTEIRIDNGWLYQLDVDKSTTKSLFNDPIIINENLEEAIIEEFPPISLKPELYSNSNNQQKGIYLKGFTSRNGETYQPAKSNTVTAYDDINIGHMIIYGGTFDPDGNLIDLDGDMAMVNSGNLKMTNSADHFDLRDIWWYPSSTANMTNGLMEIRGDWRFEDGTNCQISSGNTVTFTETTGSNTIFNQDANAHFGSVVVDENYIFLHADNNESVKISGDLTVNSGKLLKTQGKSLVVDGILDIENGGDLEVNSYGVYPSTLEINSDFDQYGELYIGHGEVTITGNYNLKPTGILTIDGGTFLRDHVDPLTDNYMEGTFNLYDGVFDVTNNGYSWDCISSTISGGIIKCKSAVLSSSGDFHPTGGSVEFYGNTNSLVHCYGDNYFWDFVVNRTGGSFYMYSDLYIKNDLIINSGNLVAQQPISYEYFDVYIEGDWHGGSFGCGQGTVYFKGNVPSDILDFAYFYNLTIDKSFADYNGVDIVAGETIVVANDLNIVDGCIELNPNTELDVNGDIVIFDNAGLNANDADVDIFIEGSWLNMNNNYDVAYGFNPGTQSTVTWDGDDDQFLFTSAPQEDFFNFTMNKSGGNFKSGDNLRIYGDLIGYDGTFYDDVWSLAHVLYGDFRIETNAAFYHDAGNPTTFTFKGTSDQEIYSDDNFGFILFSNLIIDKSVGDFVEWMDDFGNQQPFSKGIPEDSKALTVTITYDAVTTQSISVLEGTLDENGRYLTAFDPIEIYDGGEIVVGPDGGIGLYDGSNCYVKNGGILHLIGASDARTKFYCSAFDDGSAGLFVESGGTIKADYCDFDEIATAGITIHNGGIVDPVHSFNNCSFSGYDPGGTLLTIENNQTITIDSANFLPNTWGGISNVTKTANQGQVNFTNVDPASGFAGEDYDIDPYDRINWPGIVRGTWTGLESIHWSDPGNWEYHLKPGPTDDVFIPAGTSYSPIVALTSQECNNVTIEAGAALRIYDDMLTVNGNLEIYGELLMDDPSGLGILNVEEDITWYSGSTDFILSGLINIKGNWTFEDGTNCMIGTGNTVNFQTAPSIGGITIKDSDARFGNVIIDHNIYIDGGSTASLKIHGDLTVNSGHFINTQSETMIVDGEIDVQNGGRIQLHQSGLTGYLENNSYFHLDGVLDVGPGDATIYSPFDIGSTGELSIDGGSFISYGTGGSYCDIHGELNISSGLFQVEEQIVFQSTATTNITGGLIRTGSIKAEFAGTFEPSAGIVEIQTDNNSMGSVYCSNGNYFHNLKINPLITQIGGATLETDVVVQNDLEITAGRLRLNGHELTVNNDVLIFDKLIMEDPNDILNAGNESADKIIWKTGSSDIISHGVINVRGGWEFEDGTYCQIDPGNMVVFGGLVPAGIQNFDADAQFGSLTIGKTIFVDGVNTESIKITGDLNVNSGGTFVTQNQTVIVDGTMDIMDGGKIQVHQGALPGYLESNSNFVLNGELEVGTGDVMIHGQFDLETTGILTIDGGSFIYDVGYSAVPLNIRGTFNMTDGLYQAPEYFGVSATATTNVSGGLIRVSQFRAESANTFQPTGGIVEIQTANNAKGPIRCSNGNYFYNLVINPLITQLGGGILLTDVVVNNDLEVLVGSLKLDGHELTVSNDIRIYDILIMDNPNDVLNAGDSYGDQIIFKTGSYCWSIVYGEINVYGDWIFENGTDGQISSTNTVNFYGNSNSVINCFDPDVNFGSLSINKSSIGEIVEIPSGTSLRIYSNLDVIEGELKLNENTELFVSDNLTVNDGGKLNTIGTIGNESKVSGNSGYGNFEVANGGTISAEYTIFEYFGGAGVLVASGATIDPAHPFNYCTFSEGSTGGTLLTINNNQILTIDGADFPDNTWSGSYNVAKTTSQGELTFTNFSGGFSGSSYESDPNNRITWHGEDFLLNARVYLYGPYNQSAGMMDPALNNSGSVPLSQPYSSTPWNYAGSESVGSIPSQAIDWVLIELRDATSAASATQATTIARKALFVKNNGFIVDLDGSSFPGFNLSVSHNLYLVIWHRNHIGIMSADPLIESGGVYEYDFRGTSAKVYGGSAGYLQLPAGNWGMAGGDGNSDGEVTVLDKTSIWNIEAGLKGYKFGDFNLDNQVDNADKNDIWINSTTKESQVPD